MIKWYDRDDIHVLKVLNSFFTGKTHDKMDGATGVTRFVEFVDKIKRGDPNSGAVKNPDKIISIRSK